MHKPTIIIGAQWGDEGKGKLVDFFAKDYDVVGRFNGGNNAGHTIHYKKDIIKLHVLPSGVFQKKKLIISQGAVFDPEVLFQELKTCKKLGIKPDLLIDYRVNLVMPYHKMFDGAHEAWKGKQATGSVKVGIGYCYEDRNNRSGIRCEDLFYPKILAAKIKTLLPLKKDILRKVYRTRVHLDAKEIINRLLYLGKFIKPFIGDVSVYLSQNITKEKILFEGAMAVMLDASFGTYPYTVACQTVSSSLFSSLGIPQTDLEVIGVIKAYTTRVGGGPFPTEQKNHNGLKLQEIGKEIAATSGRIRRCGWLDLPIIRYAHRLNRFSYLILTKLDVLSNFEFIPICVNYKLGEKNINEYPSMTHQYLDCKPIYQTLPGWKSDISQIKLYRNLPYEAKNYIKFIEQTLKIPIKYVSVGPERKSIIKIK